MQSEHYLTEDYSSEAQTVRNRSTLECKMC